MPAAFRQARLQQQYPNHLSLVAFLRWDTLLPRNTNAMIPLKILAKTYKAMVEFAIIRTFSYQCERTALATY